MRLYACSKIRYAALWRDKRAAGWPITSTWIDINLNNNLPMTELANQLWLPVIIPEIRDATHIVALIAQDEFLKGGFLELGAMVLSGKPAAIVIPEGNLNTFRQQLGTWGGLPWVHITSHLDDAYRWLCAYRPYHPLAAPLS